MLLTYQLSYYINSQMKSIALAVNLAVYGAKVAYVCQASIIYHVELHIFSFYYLEPILLT